ncbi:MAG: hypothetical protein ACK5SX_06225 [Sandaracinobacter sp.]
MINTKLSGIGAVVVCALLAGCGGSETGKSPTAETAAPTPDTAVAQPAAAAEPKTLSDGAAAKMTRFDNMNRVRFMEIFLAGKRAGSDEIVAGAYNTLFSSAGVPPSRDTAPQALVEGLDLEKIKQEHGVLAASLNGPKIWFPDWVEVPVGVERDFNGMKAPWVAELIMGKEVGLGEDKPYQPMSIKRSSKWGWNKGTVALLLDDPDGNVWIMKGFQLGLAPKQSLDQFIAAGQANYKQLPPGWKFRIKTLNKDLIEIPQSGTATIMTDEFFNVYDKTGPGMTNYKP